MNKELEFGKRYTWKEVVAAYPAKWVRMQDCTLGRADKIIDGILVGVYNDGETDDVWNEVFDKHDKHDRLDRTEYGMGLGVIDCLNARMEVRDEP